MRRHYYGKTLTVKMSQYGPIEFILRYICSQFSKKSTWTFSNYKRLLCFKIQLHKKCLRVQGPLFTPICMGAKLFCEITALKGISEKLFVFQRFSLVL